MRRVMRSSRREEGFTLIELLVSMTLLGFVFVILFGGLRFGSRAWEKSDSETSATTRVVFGNDHHIP